MGGRGWHRVRETSNTLEELRQTASGGNVRSAVVKGMSMNVHTPSLAPCLAPSLPSSLPPPSLSSSLPSSLPPPSLSSSLPSSLPPYIASFLFFFLSPYLLSHCMMMTTHESYVQCTLPKHEYISPSPSPSLFHSKEEEEMDVEVQVLLSSRLEVSDGVQLRHHNQPTSP